MCCEACAARIGHRASSPSCVTPCHLAAKGTPAPAVSSVAASQTLGSPPRLPQARVPAPCASARRGAMSAASSETRCARPGCSPFRPLDTATDSCARAAPATPPSSARPRRRPTRTRACRRCSEHSSKSSPWQKRQASQRLRRWKVACTAARARPPSASLSAVGTCLWSSRPSRRIATAAALQQRR